MKRTLNLSTSFAAALLVVSFAFPTVTLAQPGSNAIASRTAEIDGLKLHYLTAGHGPSVILLHGYAETSLMWRPIMPLLAERFTVIAPDLPGIGDSAIPADGLDMKSRGDPHACARPVAWRAKGQGGRARYRPDGRVCLRRPVSCGGGETGGDGCLPARSRPGGRPSTTIPGILAFPL